MMKNSAQYRHDLHSYIWGLGSALILTAIPFAMVAFGHFATATVLWVIAVLGLIQIAAHFRFFLHIDLSRQKREDLHLILFSLLLLIIMGGGTIWIMFNLAVRMTPT